MRSSRRVTQRVAPALASLASVLLFATCDFDKISGTPTPITQQEIDRLFSITPADTTLILGGTTTLSITPGANVDLSGTTRTWSSSNTGVIAINSETGVATGVTIGNAVITARVIAPELDSGYSKTRALRVRYKGIKACGVAPLCSPSAIDSIAGLNLSRPFSFFGTNNSDARQATALTGVTVTTRDSGATTNTVVAVTGSNVFARKNGAAYVIGVFESMRDSIKVRVRQVAKSLTFPTTDYIANAINANRTHAVVMKDVNDSVMTASPRLRWRSSDTTVFTIDSITGVLRVKKNDTARIFVSVDTILNRNQKLLVRQAISNITKFAGDITSDTVGRLVTIVPTVTVVDSGNTAIQGDTVTFRVGSGGGVITDSVKLTDVNGRASVGSWQLGTTIGAQTLIATSGPRTTTFTVTGIPQRAYKLAFGVQPRATATNAAMTPAVTVTIRDSLNNLVTTATDSVFVAIGNNPGTATLSGTRRAAAVNGVATFANLALNAAASGYTLAATGAGTLLSTISDAFDIFGTAAKLGVIRQPVGTSAGAVLDTIQVAIQDASGNTVANDTRNVTLTIGTNAGGGGLAGTTTVAAVGGVATFTGLSINAAGAGYTLNAAASGITGAVTNPFTITAVGAPSRLAFTTQPGNVASGATPNLAVTIQDANGATVSTSTAPVTLTLIAGSNTGVLSGSTTRNAVNGVATFPGISIDKVGTGYKLSASSSGLTGAESNAFNVTPGAAAKLGFLAQPTHSVVSTTMSPAVTVAIQDAAGNTVTSQPPTNVTVTAQTCAGVTISGTVATVNGIATFSSLAMGTTQANNCTLQATSTGLTSGTSTTFNVVAATGAIRLVFGTQPSQATAGNVVPFFTVRAVDASGATVTTATPGVTISVLSGPTTTLFGTTGATASSGVASFSSVQIRTAGTYKLLATSTGFKADSSNAFTVVAGSLNRVGWITEPGSITAGAAFTPELAASFQDQFGNTITSATGNIEVGIQNGPGSGVQVVGTRLRPAVNGVATFPGLTINRAFTGYTLFAVREGGGINGSVSGLFNVTPGPVSTLTLSNEPNSLTAGGLFSVTASATDAAGNSISTFSNPITIGVTGGDGTATVIGTTTLTPTGGVANFSGLTIQKAGTNYRLSASASGLTTATGSNEFTVFAGNATKLGWINQPQNTFQNAPLNPSGQLPRVAAQDQYGNTATHFSTVRITLVAPGGVELRDNGFSATFADRSPSGGIATLTGITLTGVADNIKLTASSPFGGLTSATSDEFDLAAFSTKTKLGFKVQPSNATYAVAVNPAIEVAVQDTYGNTVTTATDAVTMRKGTDPNGNTLLSPDSVVSAVSGVATFSNMYLDKTGSGFTLEATSAALASATSSSFNVTSPGLPAQNVSMADMVRVGNRIYWLEFGSSGSVKSVAVTGGAIETIAAIANGKRIATDGISIYWSEGGSGVGTGSIRRHTPGTGTVTLAQNLAELRSEPETFWADGVNVFFIATNAAGTSAAIRRVPADAAGPQTPTEPFTVSPSNTSLVPFFTVSGSQLFFYDPSVGIVKRMPLAGGAATNVTVAGQNASLLKMVGTTLMYAHGSQDIRTVANAASATGATPSTPVDGSTNIYNMVPDGTFLIVNVGGVLRRYDTTTFGGTASFTTLTPTSPVNTPAQQNFQTPLIDTTHAYYFSIFGHITKVIK